MSIVEGVKNLLKSTERKSELIRIQKLLEEKKTKGLIITKTSVVPNLQDAERYSRNILFGDRTS